MVVIDLLSHALADTLQLATAMASPQYRFVMDLAPPQRNW
jgi:hypothetical protein